MIDEKTLSKFEGVHWVRTFYGTHPVTKEDGAELIRLARLGLWASSVGIPALKYYGFELVPDSINSGKTLITTATGYRARSSLNELPRDAS